MNLRYELYKQAARHNLDMEDTNNLLRLAMLGGPPSNIAARMARVIGIAGATLAGLAVIFFIAANWDGFGRLGRMCLIQAFFVVSILGAWRWPMARVPLSVMAFIAIGGVLACLGQTYQTGADPWQLFALWAVLALPLCWSLKCNALWAPWVAVAQLAAAKWATSNTGWWISAGDLVYILQAWGISAILLLLAHPVLQRFTGASTWTLRLGTTLLVVLIVCNTLPSLYSDASQLYFWALLVLFGAVKLFRTRMLLDRYCAAISFLALGALLLTEVAGKISLYGGDGQLTLLLLGMTAIGLAYSGTTLLALRPAATKSEHGEAS